MVQRLGLACIGLSIVVSFLGLCLCIVDGSLGLLHLEKPLCLILDSLSTVTPHLSNEAILVVNLLVEHILLNPEERAVHAQANQRGVMRLRILNEQILNAEDAANTRILNLVHLVLFDLVLG